MMYTMINYILYDITLIYSSQVIDHGVGINSLTDIMSTES